MSAQKKMVPPMQVFTYLVKIVAGSSESTRVWSSKQPMIVGHPMRWEMAQTEEGVKVTARWTKTEHFVKNAEIAKGKAFVNLAGSDEKGAGSIRVEITPVAKLAAAFRQEPTAGTSLKIFHCIGDWAVESVALSSKYVGKVAGDKVFILKGNADGVYTPDALIEICALADGLTVTGGKTELKLAKGESRQVKFMDISGVTLRYRSTSGSTAGQSEWRLASFARDSDPAFLAVPIANDIEAGLFKRTLMGALAASLLLGLIAFLIPSPPPEAKVETIKILLKKKVLVGHKTAAPTGDPHAREFSVGKTGSAKNAGKKGALAQSKKVAPAGKPEKVAAQAAKSAPAKAVAKAAPQKSAPKAVAKASPKKSTSGGAPKRTASHSRAAPTVAAKPAPIPHSDLFKAFSSSTFQRTAKGLAAGGSSAAAMANSGDAHRLGSAGGTGRGDLGGTGGVETRSASVSGFGGGGGGDGDGGPGSKGAGYGRGSNSKVSGQGRSFVSMDTGASDVEEGLTSDQVARVINSHMKEVRYCFDSATLRNESIGGRMTTKFAVGSTGDVQTAGVGSSTVGDRRLHDCIVSHLRGWKFPKPRGGKTVAVQFPFDFKKL